MKHAGKRFAAVLMVVVMALSLLPVAALATQETVDLTSGLVGYWTFDGDTEQEKLSSKTTGGPAATLASGVSLVNSDLNAEAGGGVQFNGASNGYLKLELAGEHALSAEKSFSVGAWLKHTDWTHTNTSAQQIPSVFHLGGGQAILGFQHNAAEGGRYSSYLGGENKYDGRSIGLDTWHHVMLVFTTDGSARSIRIYVNGTSSSSVNVNAPVFQAGNANTDMVGKLLVGAHRNGEAGIKAVMDELRYYERAITADEVSAIYEKDKPPVEPTAVTVNPEDAVREITPAMFGINHRYHKNAYGTWDSAAEAVNESFSDMVKLTQFGSVRYPGGTVSNLFTWKDSIGPMEERTPTIAGNNFYSNAGEEPVAPGFGLDEAARWIYDELGAEMIYVYGMGRGSAQDAADLVEYLNAPNDGSNPGGGTDWAAVRAENGHPEPYGVTKFELGNEFTDVGQNYWATPRGSNAAQAVEDYIMGGQRTFAGETQYYQHNDYVVKKGDWRAAASLSDGNPNEERYLCYVPVIEDSATIYVNGAKWEIVDTLEDVGAANVCTLDCKTGKITFGDGTNGNIPPRGQRITAHYSSNRDGFAACSEAMKGIANEIGAEIEVYSGLHHACQDSFIDKMHEKGYDDLYDGVVYHPYTGNVTYNGALSVVAGYANEVTRLRNKMQQVTGEDTRKVAVSEFGINNSGDASSTGTNYASTMGNAIYTANFMIDCVNAGAAYLNRHCLVDFTVGDNLGAWNQCVIQCLGSAGSAVSENSYIATPSLYTFQLFNTMTGSVEVSQTITGSAASTVKVYSTKDADGNVYALVVNNSETDENILQLGVNEVSLGGKTVAVQYLTSDEVTDKNTEAEPNQVTIQTAEVTVDNEAEVLTYTLRPHSIYAFRISDAAEPAPGPVPVDKTALETAITAATAAKKDIEAIDGKTEAEVDKGTKFVTTTELTELETAIAAAQAVLESAESQTAVDAAVETLEQAVKDFNAAIKTGAKDNSGSSGSTGSSRPSTSTHTETTKTETLADGSKVTTKTEPDGTVTVTTEKPDGTSEAVETKKDGTVTQTVTAPDGGKTEKVTTPDKNVTITVTDESGEELVKAEIPAAIPEPEVAFDDVEAAAPWAVEAVNKIAGLELVNGTGGNKYSPAAPMTRGSLATVLHRLSQGKTDYEVTFQDVAQGKYYTEGVAWAAKAKVVTGYTADIFAPDDIITREQLAVMMARYAKLVGLDTKADAKALDQFVDGDTTGTWAVDGVAWCVQNGILKGKGNDTLDPTAEVTRAEVAVMLDRFIALIRK